MNRRLEEHDKDVTWFRRPRTPTFSPPGAGRAFGERPGSAEVEQGLLAEGPGRRCAGGGWPPAGSVASSYGALSGALGSTSVGRPKRSRSRVAMAKARDCMSEVPMCDAPLIRVPTTSTMRSGRVVRVRGASASSAWWRALAGTAARRGAWPRGVSLGAGGAGRHGRAPAPALGTVECSPDTLSGAVRSFTPQLSAVAATISRQPPSTADSLRASCVGLFSPLSWASIRSSVRRDHLPGPRHPRRAHHPARCLRVHLPGRHLRLPQVIFRSFQGRPKGCDRQAVAPLRNRNWKVRPSSSPRRSCRSGRCSPEPSGPSPGPWRPWRPTGPSGRR